MFVVARAARTEPRMSSEKSRSGKCEKNVYIPYVFRTVQYVGIDARRQYQTQESVTYCYQILPLEPIRSKKDWKKGKKKERYEYTYVRRKYYVYCIVDVEKARGWLSQLPASIRSRIHKHTYASTSIVGLTEVFRSVTMIFLFWFGQNAVINLNNVTAFMHSVQIYQVSSESKQ